MSQTVAVVYTDGSCIPSNPGPGGWAYLKIVDGVEDLVTGATQTSTNNRMELTAAVEALRSFDDGFHIELHTDSKYVQKGISEWITSWKRNNWRRGNKPVKNKDLWQALDKQNARLVVRWKWVKAHDGHALNERVDEAARQAAIRQ